MGPAPTLGFLPRIIIDQRRELAAVVERHDLVDTRLGGRTCECKSARVNNKIFPGNFPTRPNCCRKSFLAQRGVFRIYSGTRDTYLYRSGVR